MGPFLVWCHGLICIVLSLCKHACKDVCDVNPGIDPYPLLGRSCDRWWPHFVTFTKSRFGLKSGKKAQCLSNKCKDLFERKKYFGVRCTLKMPGSRILEQIENVMSSWANAGPRTRMKVRSKTGRRYGNSYRISGMRAVARSRGTSLRPAIT